MTLLGPKGQELLYEGAPPFLTVNFAIIAGAVLIGIVILLLIARAIGVAARRRREEQEALDAYYAAQETLEAPPEPEPTPAPEPAPEPEPAPAPEAAPSAPADSAPETEEVPVPAEPAPEPVAEAPVEPAPEPEPEAPAAHEAPAVPAAAELPADDLTRMKGVGPRLEEKLKSLGIKRFGQIANLSPEDAAALDAQLGDFQGRMARDRWIDQARLLANGDIAAYEAQFGKL
ncbi:hypothetical protein [Stakelama tenebrarum]|uniref:Uncharacterized protein n=1 Tax=Stakelama tenebrarum TaxID=2711215 RepID=A0A6G6Y2I3_9SPHN|nr:hypothetical protein [Sphingosinithalassobacter tenebrarum]QIG78928.1 hypothetical protein G5C33_03425 [Sphingosinithalassobacter tenebrarum]